MKMNPMLTLIALLTICIQNGCTQVSEIKLIAIENVNIIPMDSERILESQTVIVKDDKIIKIYPFSKNKVPISAQIIDGRNKYLIPGLMDLHVHFEEFDLLLYIANGITTIRNLNGNETHLEMRKKIDLGILFGPRVFTSGPLITVPETRWKIKVVPSSVENARVIVRNQKEKGYDFIKVYNGLSEEIYSALLDEANKQNLPVVGHIPESVGLEEALNKGQGSIDHMEQIVYAFFGFQFNIEKIPLAVDMIKKSETWVCPTLAVQEIFKLNSQGKFLEILESPEMAYVDPGIMSWWKNFASPNSHNTATSDHRLNNETVDFYNFQLALTKELFEAGVPLIAGTDSPNPGMVHGYSLHEELRNLVVAGLSPYDALKTATINGALFLGKENEFGMIKEGMVADLILLDKNPLENITNTKFQSGVMVRGKWYGKDKLELLMLNLLKTKN